MIHWSYCSTIPCEWQHIGRLNQGKEVWGPLNQHEIEIHSGINFRAGINLHTTSAVRRIICNRKLMKLSMTGRSNTDLTIITIQILQTVQHLLNIRLLIFYVICYGKNGSLKFMLRIVIHWAWLRSQRDPGKKFVHKWSNWMKKPKCKQMAHSQGL